MNQNHIKVIKFHKSFKKNFKLKKMCDIIIKEVRQINCRNKMGFGIFCEVNYIYAHLQKNLYNSSW